MPSPGMRVTVCLPPYFAGGGCNIELCCYCNMMQILKIKLQFIFQFFSKHKEYFKHVNNVKTITYLERRKMLNLKACIEMHLKVFHTLFF